MSENADRPIPKELWRHLPGDGGVLGGVIAPVLLWIMYVAVVHGGVHFGSSAPSDKSDETLLFWMAVASVPLGLGYAAYSAFRWYLLVKEGVVVEGRVAKYGLSNGDLTHMEFTYEVNRRKYKKAISVGSQFVESFGVGDRIQVLIHPHSPKVCLVVEESFTDLGLTKEERKAKYEPDPELHTDAALEKYRGWWKTGGIGVFLMAAAVYEYFDLTAFQKSGGTKSLDAFSGMVYGLLGKWGVVLVTAGLGLLAAWIGYDEWRKLNRARQKAAQPAGQPKS